MNTGIIAVIFFILCALASSASNGRLLLVGGGSEKNGASGWSTPAYRWAVEDKTVAVIGTSTGSLASYLESYCGASDANEIAIATRDSADSQNTYNALVAYDVIFFRGGDQWEYYNLYRNTKLQEAVEFVYSQGGTVCGTSAGMHILSSVIFTAEEGTVYPYECIENPNNLYVTLEDDFFNFMPGYLFDTHFAERGRFGRLCGFLANLQLNDGVSITGLGIDDLTCMTVDTNGLGTVYGTGCANIYTLQGTVALNGTKLLADSVKVVQLLHGCTYHFSTGEATFESLNRDYTTDDLSETGNYSILASGTSQLGQNVSMLTDFGLHTGQASDPVLVVSGNQAQAQAFIDKLIELGIPVEGLISMNSSQGSDTLVAGRISRASKFLFTANDPGDLTPFILTENGRKLKDKISADGSVTAFVGEDARLAGKTVVDNYLEYGNSYYGEMIFIKGFGLLKNTVIIPETYLNSDVYENTATAIPYAMALDTLKYGIWLTNHNYMKYTPSEGKALLSGYGIAPVMVLKNTGHRSGFSSHTATGSTSIKPRQVAGMERLTLTLTDETRPFVMGDIQSAAMPEYKARVTGNMKTNRAGKQLMIETNIPAGRWELVSANGSKIAGNEFHKETVTIDMHGISRGIYILKITSHGEELPYIHKFIW